MTGTLYIDDGDFMVSYQAENETIILRTLSDDYYKWMDTFISNDYLKVPVEFAIEQADYFDQKVSYAKFTTEPDKV